MESNPVRIEELLAHAGWVRKLAGRLVRDAGTADDVSQEVWAHALRSPPQDRTNLRAWLASAVRNSVRSLKRAEVRRVDREAAVEVTHEEPATSEIVERAQLHRHLVEQVLALEEPHRSIVLAHWFEEQSIAEIARRQNMTERVARSRLDAGHASLRQRLDKSPGGRAAWCLGFTKWIGPSLAPVGAGTALTVGGVLMASKLVIGSAVVVVAAGLGWLLWPTLETQHSVASATSAPNIRVHDPITEAQSLVEDHAAPAREALAKQPTPVTSATAAQPRWIVRGTVRGAPAGRETETKLSAQFIGRYVIRDTAVAQARSDGSYEIDLTAVLAVWLRNGEPTEFQIVAEHPLCARVEVRLPFASARMDSASLDHEFRCDFALQTAAVVTGRVVLPPDWKAVPAWGGEPPGPAVSLFDFANAAAVSNQGVDHAQCNSDGTWILRARSSGRFTVIAQVAGLHPSSLVVELALGQSVDVGAITLQRGASISGTVRRGGRPIGAGARVVARRKDGGRVGISVPAQWTTTYLDPVGNEFDWVEVRGTTLSDGTYSLDGLASAEYELSVESIPEFRAALGGRRGFERIVRAPQSGVDLDGVQPTVHLVLQVDGRAPTEAELEGAIAGLVPLSSDSSRFDIDLTRSTTGYGPIQLVAGVTYELRVPAERYAAKVVPIGPLEVGDERTLTLDLNTQDQSASLVVRFVTDDARASNVAQFAFQPIADAGETGLTWRSVERSPEGNFVLRECTPGNWRVRVRPYDSVGIRGFDYLTATTFDVVLAPKATVERELKMEVGGRLRLSARNELGGFVRTPVELRNAWNEKIPTEFYCLSAGGTLNGCGWYLCEFGPNDHPPLPAGHYELTLSAPDFAKQVVPFDIVGGETKTLEVVLHPR